MSADLSEGSFRSEELVEEADGDAEHGGQSQTPADDLAPPRVHVHVVVGQRLVVDQVEQEDALWTGEKKKTGRKRLTANTCGTFARPTSRPSSLTMQTHGVMMDQHHFIQGNGR